MKLKFGPGDIIQNNKPYKGETPKLIISFDKYGYICVEKLYDNWYFKATETIFFDGCESNYTKIDFVKIKLNIIVED